MIKEYLEYIMRNNLYYKGGKSWEKKDITVENLGLVLHRVNYFVFRLTKEKYFYDFQHPKRIETPSKKCKHYSL